MTGFDVLRVTPAADERLVLACLEIENRNLCVVDPGRGARPSREPKGMDTESGRIIRVRLQSADFRLLIVFQIAEWTSGRASNQQ
jgi:hypothetical protein